MKFSEQWLREWVNPPASRSELVEELTLAGFEVDSVMPIAADFCNVVVGEVIEVVQHPDADRLRVCQVDVAEQAPLTIVCGAKNVREGLKVAVAKVNAVLPGDFKIKKNKLRGVDSFGMICSENELGLAEASSGIMELPSDAPIGVNIRDYLKLDDAIIDVDFTPNRGDCLSIQGLAREVAAFYNLEVTRPYQEYREGPLSPSNLSVVNQAPDACPHYIGRVITDIRIDTETPIWMKEKLRRSDIRSISPIVDITNYVLLELGQPLHSFDLSKVAKGIEIRFAEENEKIHLLDDQELTLSSEDLVISSNDKPVALAGIKGGSDSGINEKTTDIFLESALFHPSTISKTCRKFKLFTDSSHRFEKGVDYHLQRQAIERASALILEIVGGNLGEIQELGKPFKKMPSIFLRENRIGRILGIQLPKQDIKDLLQRLSMETQDKEGGWEVIPPSYRQDIVIEIDVIEEIARLHGYDNIPGKRLSAELRFVPKYESYLDINHLKQLLMVRGYQEAITYSFVDPKYEKLLGLQKQPLEIINPIASDLAVMRTNLWSGLLKTYQYNYHRQQSRVRLFEVGLCFYKEENKVIQSMRISGLSAGLLYKEQWGEPKRAVDFFDVKADVENILLRIGKSKDVRFEPYAQTALHPGKAASIYLGDQLIGSVGAIHPNISQTLDINQSLYLFDLNLEPMRNIPLSTYKTISKFPAIRRDIALMVATDVPAERIKEKILDSGADLLKNVQIFDVYQGKGIDPNKKSIALSLFFQHDLRTLIDSEINSFMQNIINILYKEFDAILRD
jgi:phenylalanyl-tRNA synthetase beta chain